MPLLQQLSWQPQESLMMIEAARVIRVNLPEGSEMLKFGAALPDLVSIPVLQHTRV